MSGHLFITRGDLRDLACDAILVPSGVAYDGSGRLGHIGTKAWTDLFEWMADGDGFAKAPPTRTGRVARQPDLDRGRAVWVGHTGEDREDPCWYADALDAFVREAAASTHRLDARPFGDERTVVAVPLVGSGKGGMSDRKGELMRETVERLATAAADRDCDVVLVLVTREAYAAAQQVRSSLPERSAWAGLGDLARHGDRLAGLARAGSLVVFAGAGASMGAGAPSWSELLTGLAREAGLTEAELKALGKLDARDAAAVIERRLGSVQRLRSAVIAATAIDGVSVLHQLLASLPVDEVVTTNYDDCLERAFAATGRRLQVLPHEPVSDLRRWIVKLHGSVHDPSSIVLSRDDYLRFEGQHAALAGLVQALLLTRHMLFVGYGLNDDNFHRMVHEVRQVTRGRGGERSSYKLATALSPKLGGLMQRVWEEDIHYVTAGTAERPDDPRRVAILVDYVGARSAQAGAHLLDESYRALFSEAELELRNAIDRVRTLARRPSVPVPVRDAVDGALGSLGGRDV